MSRHARVLRLLCLVLAIALLASCSGKKQARPVPTVSGEIADLREFPQDLNRYASGSRKSLMSPSTQAFSAAGTLDESGDVHDVHGRGNRALGLADV